LGIMAEHSGSLDNDIFSHNPDDNVKRLIECLTLYGSDHIPVMGTFTI
jgi:endonuclease/exonuclease/phosphatase (EEP) superfamily protein YafD